MLNTILKFSIQWRLLIIVLCCLLIGLGVYSALQLPIDAVPDITTNQVQINTVAPAFAPEEIEKYITFPIEVAMSSLPKKEEIRSISQFGLSQVTVIFDDNVDIYWARQLVLEKLLEAERELPSGVSPEMAPVSTGLGEIYQFTVETDEQSPTKYSPMELRTILDWQIKPQLRTVPGVIEVNSFGGMEKQYEVLVDPNKLLTYNITLREVIESLERNNINAGGAYLEKSGEQQLIRGVGLIRDVGDIENIVVASLHGKPIHINDVAKVGLGSQVRQGAATRDGKGETVMGITMLLKGENSRTVTQSVRERLEKVQQTLPPGVKINPFYDRTELVNKTVNTAATNLLEGGFLVILVLFLFLLQLKAGLVVSSVIPLAMLCAIIGMKQFGISANLMSLGAIDFGLIVDGAVVIVENIIRRLANERKRLDRRLTQPERMNMIHAATTEVYKPAFFGMLIIISAYIPILTLVGIEGKMFRPMAFTVIFALLGAVLLNVTLIPSLCAYFLKEPKKGHTHPVLDRLILAYESLLRQVIRHRYRTVGVVLIFVLISGALFFTLGSEFIPELDEGAIAINHARLKSCSLSESIRQTTLMENALKQFP
ncbi:MAG: CusA/CzcA family heavy metal efflux RND transporter, partial [Planctomycetota bacterium]